MAITRSQQARQMLKTAGAVEQDGVLNYIKNSESVTVPKEFKARIFANYLFETLYFQDFFENYFLLIGLQEL